MKSSRHPLTPHAAHVLAARLRERGVYAAGRDVLRWPGRSIVAAQLWLELDNRMSWREFMGDDMPPPSQHSWPSATPERMKRMKAEG